MNRRDLIKVAAAPLATAAVPAARSAIKGAACADEGGQSDAEPRYGEKHMQEISGLLALFLFVGLSMPVAQARSIVEKPNVIIILADDLGYGDTSAYGAAKIATPNMDRLAKEGRLYTDAHSPSPVCSPSRYQLMTGRYSWRTWVKSGAIWARDPMLIEKDRFTLADLFKSHGYRTALIGKWHLGFGAPGTPGWSDVLGPDYNLAISPGPLDVGFDYVWTFPHVGQQPHIIIENRHVLGLRKDDPLELKPGPFFYYFAPGKSDADLAPLFLKSYQDRPRNGANESVTVTSGNSALYDESALSDLLTARATSYIRAQRPELPFFLYLAHRNPHAPYKPAPRFAGRSDIGPYGDMIAELDWSVGEVLRTLDEQGLWRNTIVILASDNGAMNDFSGTVRAGAIDGHARNGPLRGQKTDVYEGGHRVPLMIRWPGHVAAGSRSDALVALTDMLATFADYFHYTLKADAGEDSFSFLGDILSCDQDRPTRHSLVSDASVTGALSLRERDWKLIEGQSGGGLGIPQSDAPDPSMPRGQLYYLRKDLAEMNNLYDREPERVARMERELEEIRTSKRSAPFRETRKSSRRGPNVVSPCERH